jgi:hypothetical protein
MPTTIHRSNVTRVLHATSRLDLHDDGRVCIPHVEGRTSPPVSRRCGLGEAQTAHTSAFQAAQSGRLAPHPELAQRSRSGGANVCQRQPLLRKSITRMWQNNRSSACVQRPRYPFVAMGGKPDNGRGRALGIEVNGSDEVCHELRTVSRSQQRWQGLPNMNATDLMGVCSASMKHQSKLS